MLDSGTGDGASIFFTTQSLASVLGKLGVSITGQLADFEAANQATGRLDLKMLLRLWLLGSYLVFQNQDNGLM